MFRRPKDLAQLARLENAAHRLESAKSLLWDGGEPMLATQVSALLDKTRMEIQKSKERLGMCPPLSGVDTAA